jgi:hypothetical protein
MLSLDARPNPPMVDISHEELLAELRLSVEA